MDIEGRQFNISEGTDVYGSDGEKVGSVVAVQPNYVVVEKGFFFPTDYYIPTSSIASEDEGRVYLSVTKDQALNQGWDTEPTGGYATETVTTGTADLGTTATDVAYDADIVRTDAGMGMAADTTRVDTGETIAVPVREEELTATKSQREIGEVRIEKDVVSEQRTIEVPVTEERVRVERRVVDRAADASDATAFEEGVIEVPIMGEEVELQKRVRVAEEVEIGKEAVQRTEQVAGTVRREEVRVTETDTDVSTTGTRGQTTAEGEGLVDRATDTVRDAGRNI